LENEKASSVSHRVSLGRAGPLYAPPELRRDRGARMASSGADEPRASWPRPCSPPSRPGEAARAEEARRAVLAQARGASLTIADVPTLLADDALGLLVVNKPAGVYVDDVSRVVAGAFVCPRTRPKVTMLHRLDRDTSGCLAFPTRPESNRSFARAFGERAAKKTYVCEMSTSARCRSTTEDASRSHTFRAANLPLRVRTGHGRSAHGLWRVYPAADVGAALPSEKGKAGNRVRLAETRVAAVTRDRYAFLGLDTGRTHQIRLHMAHLGWPLVGDVKYGGAREVETREAAAEVSFFRLHAARLRLPRGGGDDNRGDGRFVEVEAPKPWWFEETSDGEYARALGEAVGVVEREPTF